ncbi:type III pantothenate kinase [Pseudomaricurvus alcaniphilus]|uniref:type III pantothenate kinase n=1 Tax=Pseudomaricurvus alcaniphilus TaxID=1166482 RepID=UPI00140C2AB7|nr:type III pantothenate kinase [Pseudomaricurvus alcaniphilus]
MTLLEIDVGNTRLKWRLRSGGQVLGRGALVRRQHASPAALLATLQAALLPLLRGGRLQQVWVASVAAEEVSTALAAWAEQEFAVCAEFARVSASAGGVRVGYDDPARLGVDRWLAVLAAARRELDGVVVVDCGSAITVDILQGNIHQGGYIVPGLQLMRAALFKDTARVKVAAWQPTDGAPGRNTEAAVNGGLPLMVTGFVREVLARQAAAGWWQPGYRAGVLLTGGDGTLLQRQLQVAGDVDIYNLELVEDLVLDGLQWSAKRPWQGVAGGEPAARDGG